MKRVRKAFDEEFQKAKKIKTLPTKQQNFGALIKSAMAQFHEQKQCLDQYIQTLPFTADTSFIEVDVQILSQKVDELFSVKAQQDSYDVLHSTSGSKTGELEAIFRAFQLVKSISVENITRCKESEKLQLEELREKEEREKAAKLLEEERQEAERREAER